MCGVFGAVVPPGSGTEAATVAALGLFALQHRGQESAGVAVSDASSSRVLTRLPLWPIASARRGPSRKVGWAFSQTVEPVVE